MAQHQMTGTGNKAVAINLGTNITSKDITAVYDDWANLTSANFIANVSSSSVSKGISLDYYSSMTSYSYFTKPTITYNATTGQLSVTAPILLNRNVMGYSGGGADTIDESVNPSYDIWLVKEDE